jgi:hypothetical protein
MLSRGVILCAPDECSAVLYTEQVVTMPASAGRWFIPHEWRVSAVEVLGYYFKNYGSF